LLGATDWVRFFEDMNRVTTPYRRARLSGGQSINDPMIAGVCLGIR
jgi:hypothetical protein